MLKIVIASNTVVENSTHNPQIQGLKREGERKCLLKIVIDTSTVEHLTHKPLIEGSNLATGTER